MRLLPAALLACSALLALPGRAAADDAAWYALSPVGCVWVGQVRPGAETPEDLARAATPPRGPTWSVRYTPDVPARMTGRMAVVGPPPSGPDALPGGYRVVRGLLLCREAWLAMFGRRY